MSNIIHLEFKNNLEVLAGNKFGREIYFSQIQNKFLINEENIIEFPDTIEMICSSFVQGMFSELLKKYTPNELIKKIIIKNPEHENDIKEGLLG